MFRKQLPKRATFSFLDSLCDDILRVRDGTVKVTHVDCVIRFRGQTYLEGDSYSYRKMRSSTVQKRKTLILLVLVRQYKCGYDLCRRDLTSKVSKIFFLFLSQWSGVILVRRLIALYQVTFFWTLEKCWVKAEKNGEK